MVRRSTQATGPQCVRHGCDEYDVRKSKLAKRVGMTAPRCDDPGNGIDEMSGKGPVRKLGGFVDFGIPHLINGRV
jgi:hypothetical protein